MSCRSIRTLFQQTNTRLVVFISPPVIEYDSRYRGDHMDDRSSYGDRRYDKYGSGYRDRGGRRDMGGRTDFELSPIRDPSE